MTIAMVMNDNQEKQLKNLFSWLSKVTPITMILNSGKSILKSTAT